jgi:hypothetical protein
MHQVCLKTPAWGAALANGVSKTLAAPSLILFFCTWTMSKWGDKPVH